ncbi:hypothetical protein ALC152_22570 [Arcobacter sp. 15-2]|uniref:hypothetical protein n=1 Tax=Arcobacter sp. 15-2 TaxID=3374109 RepID=UPI00399C92B9
MKIAIALLVIGLVLILLLSNLKFKKQVLSKIGIVIGILFLLYGTILLIQPKEYIKYTKTTISKDTNSSNNK